MGNFLVDEHEPGDIARFLDMAHDVEVGPWNAQGGPDYGYTGVECYCHESNQYNTERKTWLDMLDLESVEAQIQKWVLEHRNEHNRLVLEGVVEPAVKGILIYSRDKSQNVLRAGLRGDQQQTYKAIMAWLRQIGKYVEVMQTSTPAASAIALSAWYTADQIEEEGHKTLMRVFKNLDYRVNPQEQRILSGAGRVPIGPVKAEALVKHFGTAWRAWSASVEEWEKVPGIGRKLAQDYLRGIGRGNV